MRPADFVGNHSEAQIDGLLIASSAHGHLDGTIVAAASRRGGAEAYRTTRYRRCVMPGASIAWSCSSFGGASPRFSNSRPPPPSNSGTTHAPPAIKTSPSPAASRAERRLDAVDDEVEKLCRP